ncbi:hypothetical protein OG21DRAFT_1494966 [Imleria badia]|nr:hypothetical protein OG21DRAFT_1494966 [Imleria badia]
MRVFSFVLAFILMTIGFIAAVADTPTTNEVPSCAASTGSGSDDDAALEPPSDQLSVATQSGTPDVISTAVTQLQAASPVDLSVDLSALSTAI